MTAIRMATLNTAEHFGVAQDIGCIAPGRFADVLIVSDLERLVIDLVVAAGQIVAERGKLRFDVAPYPYPREVLESVHLARPLTAGDFDVAAPVEEGTVACRVIEVIENQVLTRAARAEFPVEEGKVLPDSRQDIALLAVVERHHASGQIGLGLGKGFGLTERCALASTVAHDSHNLLIAGTDAEAMAEAGNHVAEMGGGVCLVKDDRILASIPLSIAGLMSDQPVERVAEQAEALHDALRRCGCSLNNAFMPFSFLALPVIPELRLTDRGLVDVASQSLVTLFG